MTAGQGRWDRARFQPNVVDDALARGEAAGPAYRHALAEIDAALDACLDAGASAHEVVAARASAVDGMLVDAWQRCLGPRRDELALVAVGGCGRGELQPYSDIDILVLCGETLAASDRDALERFVTLLWDIGLEVGHAVRTVDECVEVATSDVTTATNLMESRLLDGSRGLYEAMRAATGADQIWPAATFFRVKLAEQRERHRKFDDTAYRLEPNIKEGPGGLRDIQMVGWVAKRHFGATTLADLVGHGFLTPDELKRLHQGQERLWRIRWRLHRLSRRREDRLLFDHQRELARAFGETAEDPNAAVEAFMQRYYRMVMQLQRLNEILLQFFREAILESGATAAAHRLDEHFCLRGDTLEAARADTFRRDPTAILAMFVTLARHPEARGIRAETLRQLHSDLEVIDDAIRRQPEMRGRFMDLLRQPRGVASQLVRMNRYGVLGAYLPAFDRVVGRMQYDLFHTYTVDEHTLRVIAHLRRFRLGEDPNEDALCCQLMGALDHPETLYIAALFHDIAKGQDGDHSELGAREAITFCQDHGVAEVQTGLVAWLVRHHLVLSMTAQRRDLTDPDVIHEFARTVSSIAHLNHLYLLTVADIRATNPSLWNSWRANLLRELYHKTVQALWRGLDNPIDSAQRLSEVQAQARQILAQQGTETEGLEAVWSDLPEPYFLRHNADEIARHTHALAAHARRDRPLIQLRRETTRGPAELFLAGPPHRYRFALVTTVLDQLGLSVVDARILTSHSGMALDTYLILEASGASIRDEHRMAEIRERLEAALARPDRVPAQPARRPSRRMRHFAVPLRVDTEQQPDWTTTAVEVTAGDQPGLLSKIARAFLDTDVRVHSARVATVGERVDDVFFCTNADDDPLGEDDIERVKKALDHYISHSGEA